MKRAPLLAAVAAAGLLTACGSTAAATGAGPTPPAANPVIPGVTPAAAVTDCSQLPNGIVLKALAHVTGQRMDSTLVKGVRCVWSTDQFQLEVVTKAIPAMADGYTLAGSPCPGKAGSLTANNAAGSPIDSLKAICGTEGVFLSNTLTLTSSPITASQKQAVIKIARVLAG